jgi:hypothetical protein
MWRPEGLVHVASCGGVAGGVPAVSPVEHVGYLILSLIR